MSIRSLNQFLMAIDNFQWTDEKVKDFIRESLSYPSEIPAQRYLDDVLSKFKNKHTYHLKNDYEIVAYRTKYMGKDNVIFKILTNLEIDRIFNFTEPIGGTIYRVSLSENWLRKNGAEPYSVLCNGKILTLGDEVLVPTPSGWGHRIIKEFREEAGSVTATTIHPTYKDIFDQWHIGLISPYQPKQKLFTTEDGVDIYEHDDCFVVREDVYTTIKWTRVVKTGITPDEKYFSTFGAASQYIFMNKPCLSLNDVLPAFDAEKLTDYEKKKILIGTAKRKQGK